MSIWDRIGDIIQKPQSGYSGALLGLERMMGQGGGSTKNPEATNLLSGLMAGLQGDSIHPHDVLMDMAPENPNGPGIGRKILNTATDIGWDPMLALGPLLKSGALGAKAAGAGEAAFSAGKLEEGVGTGSKLGNAASRALRRTYEGTLATGNPLTGAGLGQVMGLGENQLAKILPKLGRGAIDTALTETPTPSAIRELGPAYQLDDIASGARGRSAGVAAEGDVITPEVLRRAIGPSTQKALPVGPRVPELNPSTAMPVAEQGFDRAMGPGRIDPATMDRMVEELLGHGGRGNGDNLAQIFRMILQGQ